VHNPTSQPDTGETYQPSMFQLQGRIGRVRYTAYSFAWGVLLALCMAVLMTMVGESAAGLVLVQGLGILASLAASLIVGARRLHDMGRKSWLAGGLIIPFVNIAVALWLVCAPGSPRANQYGPAPARNTRGLIVLACAIPVIFLAGLLAAIVLAPHKSAAQRAHDEMEQAI
jgi:uncharacterized membrane protein YhaH (DUF805 family)